MGDTTPAAEQIQLEAIHTMTPTARLLQAFALSEMSRRLLFAGLRARHPTPTHLQLVELALGPPLVPEDVRSIAR